MKCRNIFAAAVFLMFFSTTDGKAQMFSGEPVFRPTVFAPKLKEPDLKGELAPPLPIRENANAKPLSPLRFQKKQFLILSAAVYSAALADMQQTLAERSNSWWYETDPLARPLVRLPAPAYYVTGLALATGLNWFSWKMAHSRKWHRLAAVPQLLAIGGNSYGYKSNLFR
jgi:hypothetical protein